MRRKICFMLTICLIFGGLFSMNQFSYGNPAETVQPIKVTLDGKVIRFDQPPVNINDRVLVPMRGIFEALGAKVSWDNDNRIAKGVMGETTIKIPIDSKTVYINDKALAIDEPARIIGERTLVPVRVVSEGFGAGVSWVQDTATVVIKSPEKEESSGGNTEEKPKEEPKDDLSKQGVKYPAFTHYSQFGWGLQKQTEYSMCVASCWAMMINNMGTPANPVDVYVANGKSAYIVWSKMTQAFDVKTNREIVNLVEVTQVATKDDSEKYRENAEKIIRKYLKDNPQGVMLNFNRGMNNELHSVVVLEDKDGTLFYDDPSVGAHSTFEETYMYKRGQGWGNLYTIQTVF